ncbi:trichome birefringence-like protein [Actinidia rufa]|uniref:Trichome birefringence-like protein n=1 Tax=Actinidia rufa TaxID=165716 RepID=A0A7J0EBE7_9ERIC|nr:trichome birefringence-like protein [Actinidia rufa]
MGTAKTPRGRLPLPIVAIVIFIFFMIALLYTERFSSSIFKFKSCSRRASDAKATKSTRDDGTTEDDLVKHRSRRQTGPAHTSIGNFLVLRMAGPIPTTGSGNGSPTTASCHASWEEAHVCGAIHCNETNGNRSFVWFEFVIPDDHKSMRRGRSHSVFTVKEYNATIEFYWAPFLVESNSDNPIIGDPKKRILKVDSVSKHAKYWVGVDILAFNTYVWWMSGTKVKALWGSFANGEEGSEDLDTVVAYKIGLKTWANWIDSTLDPNKTRVFFTTMSPTHARSEDWNHEDGIKCFNETKPVSKKGHWGTGSNKQMMSVVAGVVEKMRVPITFINITQLSEYRKDGHSSVYNELGGKLLTDEQRADPKHYADCIHWCLPGVPDTWNQIFLAHL